MPNVRPALAKSAPHKMQASALIAVRVVRPEKWRVRAITEGDYSSVALDFRELVARPISVAVNVGEDVFGF